jgi:hypothetical protein
MKINFNKELFWDVHYDTLDWKKNHQWVICRVIDRGGLNDWKELNKLYGSDMILIAAKNANYLSKKTVYFISAIFNVPLNEFKCYTLMQSQPEHWIY